MPFFPTPCSSTLYPCDSSASIRRRASLIRFELKAPASPRFEVRRTTAARVGPPFARRRRPPQQRKALGQLGRDQVGQHVAQRLGVGPGGDDAVLGALQLGRGDQLHRPGDLPGVLDGADPPLELPALGHQSAWKSGLKAAMAALSRLVMSSSSAFLVWMSFSTCRVRGLEVLEEIAAPTAGCAGPSRRRGGRWSPRR